MAQTCTWQGDAGGGDYNWGTANNWHGSVTDHVKPTTGDDVVFNNAVNCVVNEATAALNSFDMTGYTGILSGASTVTVSGTAGSTTVCLFAGTITWTGLLNLTPPATATIDVTFGSLTTAQTSGGVTIAGTTTGKAVFIDNLYMASTKNLVLTSGTLYADGASSTSGLTHYFGGFSSSNSNTRTAEWGTSTNHITNANIGCSYCAIDMQNNSGITWNATLSTFYLDYPSQNGTIRSGDGGGFTNKVFGTIICSGNANWVFGGAYWSVKYMTILGGAGKNYTVQCSTASYSNPFNMVAGGSLTITGNSVTNRLLVFCPTLGTSKNIIASGSLVTMNNVDLRDMSFSTSANALTISSAADNGSGATRFLTAAAHGLVVNQTITISGTTDYNGNKVVTAVSDTTHFDIADAYVSSQAGTWKYDLTNNEANSIGDCGGNTKINFNAPTTQTWDGSTANWDTVARWTSRVPLPQDSVVLAGTNTCTANMPRLCRNISFTAACPLTITLAGATPIIYGSVDFTGAGAFSHPSNIVFESMARSGTETLICAGKIFDNTVTFNYAGGAILQFGDSYWNSSATALNSLNSLKIGDYTHYLTNTGATTVWSGNGTIDDETSTIYITGSSASVKTFTGGGKEYFNLRVGGGAGGVTIGSSNIFNSLKINRGSKLTLTANTTQKIRSFITAEGTPSLPIIITSSSSLACYLNMLNSDNYSFRNCNVSYLSSLTRKLNISSKNGNVNRFGGYGVNYHPSSRWSMFTTAVAAQNTNFFLMFN